MHWLAQIAVVGPEWIAVGVSILGLWGRMEFKLGKLEGKIEGLRK